MGREEKDKSIYELLKKLIDLECNNAKVESVIFAKKGSRLVSNKVNDMQECIEENAREYGKKIEYVNETTKIKSAIEANILRNYTLSLEKVNKQYDIKRKNIIEQTMELNKKLYDSYISQSYIEDKIKIAKDSPEYSREKQLREEAKDAIDDGDYEKLSKINNELKIISKINPISLYERKSKQIRAEIAKVEEAKEMLNKEIEKCQEDRKQAIELITGRKENLLQRADKKYLLVLKNENFIQKALGKFLNKINGNKKYTENVTNVLTKKVRDVEYKSVPSLREKLTKETEQIINKVSSISFKDINLEAKENDSKTKKYTIKGVNATLKGAKFVGSIPKKVTKVSKKIMDTGKQTYNSMIEKYRSARMWTITKMEEKIVKLENKEKQRKAEKEELEK